MFNGKNVLVAGGTGFVGVNLINRLLSLGVSVRATIHKRDEVVVDKRIEYIKADLLIMDDCKRVVKDMDYVFLCAANTAGAVVIATTPLVHVTPNVIMNSQMLEAAYFAKVKKFIWLSSNVAYSPFGDRPVKEDEIFNDDPYDTYFGVGWMKRYCEIVCKYFNEVTDTKFAMIRTTTIYGLHDAFNEKGHVISQLILKARRRDDPLEVWGNGDK